MGESVPSSLDRIQKVTSTLSADNLKKYSQIFQRILDSNGAKESWRIGYKDLAIEWNRKKTQQENNNPGLLPRGTSHGSSVFRAYQVLSETKEDLEQLLGVQFLIGTPVSKSIDELLVTREEGIVVQKSEEELIYDALILHIQTDHPDVWDWYNLRITDLVINTEAKKIRLTNATRGKLMLKDDDDTYDALQRIIFGFRC